MRLDNKKAANLATNGFEQTELQVPRDKVRAAEATVVDDGVITSRHPGDLDAFSVKMIEEASAGTYSRRSAA